MSDKLSTDAQLLLRAEEIIADMAPSKKREQWLADYRKRKVAHKRTVDALILWEGKAISNAESE